MWKVTVISTSCRFRTAEGRQGVTAWRLFNSTSDFPVAAVTSFAMDHIKQEQGRRIHLSCFRKQTNSGNLKIFLAVNVVSLICITFGLFILWIQKGCVCWLMRSKLCWRKLQIKCHWFLGRYRSAGRGCGLETYILRKYFDFRPDGCNWFCQEQWLELMVFCERFAAPPRATRKLSCNIPSAQSNFSSKTFSNPINNQSFYEAEAGKLL